MTRRGSRAAVAALAVALAGCGGTLLDPAATVEYKSAGKLPPLEIPPDLTAPARDDRYQVPDTKPTGTATFSAYNAERSGAPRAGSTNILPEIDKVKVERSGTERWLVVPEPPEKVWPVVKEFWYSPRLGINVITKRFDPRASAVQNFVVGNINQAEPNARMFEPPQGYRIVPMDGQ